MAKKRTEQEIMAELEAHLAAYHEKATTENLSPEQIVVVNEKTYALRDELQEILTAGAEKCKDCGNKPLGIHQPRFYEVGCLVCMNHRAVGGTVGQAVENWNKGIFLRPGERVTANLITNPDGGVH